MEPEALAQWSQVREHGYVRFVMRWIRNRFLGTYAAMTLPALIFICLGKAPDYGFLLIQIPLIGFLLLAISGCGVWQSNEKAFLESEMKWGALAQSNAVLFDKYLKEDHARRFLEPEEQERSFQAWLQAIHPGR